MDHHPTLTNGKISAIIKVIIAIIFRTSQRKIHIFWVLKSHVTLFWLFWWLSSSSVSCNLINPLPNIVYNNKASAARYKPPKNGGSGNIIVIIAKYDEINWQNIFLKIITYLMVILGTNMDHNNNQESYK